MYREQVDFSRQLIKGKIVEMIFSQMLREAGNFTVLAFGYENILPELVQRQGDLKLKPTMDVVKSAPDFVVINNNTHDVHLIEVKYRREISKETVLEIADKIYSSWKPAHLFIATQKGFFYGKVSEIIEAGGNIHAFYHPNISKDIQAKYLHLIKEFIHVRDLENNDGD